MNIHKEELEQRLRSLFADERLDLPPPTDVVKTIVTGARRRRKRRRGMLTATGVAAAVVVVSGGLTMVKLNAEDNTAAMTAGDTEIGTKAPDNPAAGVSPSATAPGPTSTGHIEVPPTGTSTAGTSKTQDTGSKPTPSRVYTGPLLAADGFGMLKLGMDQSQVTAQGVTLEISKAGEACTFYHAHGSGIPAPATVAISINYGLTIVTPSSVAHTAQGIGAGSTKEQVLAVYPGASDEAGGMVAPATGSSEYHFLFGGAGVNGTSLYSGNQDCTG